MKYLVVSIFIILLVQVFTASIKGPEQIPTDAQNLTDRYSQYCDCHTCSHGGCCGYYGRCDHICYCFGSHYEYRCSYCDA